MKLTRRSFVASTAATALIGLRPALAADEKVVRFGMPQDFTKIYTFVTAEYSQGQRDYFSLINGRGGVGGYKIVPDVSDHANDICRAPSRPTSGSSAKAWCCAIRCRRRSPARSSPARSRTRSISSPPFPAAATPPTARSFPM